MLCIIDIETNKGRKFSAEDLAGVDILLMTGITTETLEDAVNLARIAGKSGIVTVGIPSHNIPPESEGIQKFRKYADAVIFSRCKTERVSRRIVERISDLVNKSGFVNLDIGDVKCIFEKAGTVYFGEGSAKICTEAAKKAAEMLGDIKGARYILMSLTTPSEIRLGELFEASQIIEGKFSEDAAVIWGHVIDEDSKGTASVAIFAAMFD